MKTSPVLLFHSGLEGDAKRMIMSSRCESTVVSLLSVAKKYNKPYCFVSQKRILELLEKYHSYGISRRTLNRDLRWLEDNKFITRLRRFRKGPEGPIFCSTLYKFEHKVFMWLYSMGNRVKRFFLFYRVPKMAHYQLTQKHGIYSGNASSAKEVMIKARDGTLHRYDPSTGEYF